MRSHRAHCRVMSHGWILQSRCRTRYSSVWESSGNSRNRLRYPQPWATRGVDLFRSRDVNAPPPPYYLARPDPTIGVYRQIESSGRLQSDALEIAFRGQITRRFNGMMQYALGRAYND